ncbi:MAG: 23S rRNA (guanine(2445)-N(2))/(guanine(2069)-N(7))-methyltransferase, partial [Actinomycetota bacterium]|nr:23S rRNA (guanine(2445)-N(2))/(guanine(2069)-N(7))-methyltransferase [Actinomycetota bacterium]
VQRDHAGMLVALEALLAPGGTIVFSNNFRRFRMDHGALSRAGLVATDITAATIPQDFARNPKIHTTWNVTRADER